MQHAFRSAAALAAALSLAAGAAGAQGGMAGMDQMKRPAFSVGESSGWTLGVPHLDISGGLYSVMEKGAMPKINEGFIAARFQTGLGAPQIQLTGQSLWVPKMGVGAQGTLLIQWAPTDNDSDAYFSVGAGAVFGRFGEAKKGEPWAQAVLGWRTPIHDLAPFVQVGTPLVEGSRVQWLFGASHPLAPYKFHLP